MTNNIFQYFFCLFLIIISFSSLELEATFCPIGMIPKVEMDGNLNCVCPNGYEYSNNLTDLATYDGRYFGSCKKVNSLVKPPYSENLLIWFDANDPYGDGYLNLATDEITEIDIDDYNNYLYNKATLVNKDFEDLFLNYGLNKCGLKLKIGGVKNKDSNMRILNDTEAIGGTNYEIEDAEDDVVVCSSNNKFNLVPANFIEGPEDNDILCYFDIDSSKKFMTDMLEDKFITNEYGKKVGFTIFVVLQPDSGTFTNSNIFSLMNLEPSSSISNNLLFQVAATRLSASRYNDDNDFYVYATKYNMYSNHYTPTNIDGESSTKPLFSFPRRVLQIYQVQLVKQGNGEICVEGYMKFYNQPRPFATDPEMQNLDSIVFTHADSFYSCANINTDTSGSAQFTEKTVRLHDFTPYFVFFGQPSYYASRMRIHEFLFYNTYSFGDETGTLKEAKIAEIAQYLNDKWDLNREPISAKDANLCSSFTGDEQYNCNKCYDMGNIWVSSFSGKTDGCYTYSLQTNKTTSSTCKNAHSDNTWQKLPLCYSNAYSSCSSTFSGSYFLISSVSYCVNPAHNRKNCPFKWDFITACGRIGSEVTLD